MIDIKEIVLNKDERRSLFTFHFKKNQHRDEIKCFHRLYCDYGFLTENLLDKVDKFGINIGTDTYHLSEQYERYCIVQRWKILNSLPNWIAILISLISLILNILLWLETRQ